MEQGVGGAYLRDYYDPDITSTMFEAPKGEEDE